MPYVQYQTRFSEAREGDGWKLRGNWSRIGGFVDEVT